MKNKFPIYFIFLLVLAGSCITPITDFTQVSSQSFLSVEASLTDQAGPQKVRLYMSSDRLTGAYFTPISKAKVYFLDEKGVREDLIESSSSKGTYVSSTTFAGRVGGSYTLNIETAEGKKYKSVAETMKSAPEIENVLTRFEILDNYAKGDPRRAGFNIYLDFQDPNTLGDNYQWYWKHYQRANICETCVGGSYDFFKNTCVMPRVPTDKTLNYKCDGDCWDITFSTDINILSDAYLNGQRVTGKLVARLPFDGISPYYLQLEQRSITANSYNYYQGLKTQTQSNGTLFDVPAETRFSYNIKSTTNPEEKILGVFDVFSVRRRIFYIDRSLSNTQGELPTTKTLEGDIFTCPIGLVGCKELVQCYDGLYRTPFKPAGWKE
jgi:hypothetical protein